MDQDAFLIRFARYNLADEWPGKTGAKGDRFVGAKEARAAAEALRPALADRTVVLLGAKVCAAFGVPFVPLRRFGVPGFEAAVLPHPSGCCFWWNAAQNRADAARFLRSVVGDGQATCSNHRPVEALF